MHSLFKTTTQARTHALVCMCMRVCCFFGWKARKFTWIYMRLIHEVYIHCIRWIIVSTTTMDSTGTRGRTRWLYQPINSITSACEYLSMCVSLSLSVWQIMWLNVLPNAKCANVKILIPFLCAENMITDVLCNPRAFLSCLHTACTEKW